MADPLPLDLDAIEMMVRGGSALSMHEILALVRRVRELEATNEELAADLSAELARRDKAAEIQRLRDENARLRYAIEGDADYVHPDSVNGARLTAEYARGRREGLEEAAKIVDKDADGYRADADGDLTPLERRLVASALATTAGTIRATAKEQAPQSPEGPAPKASDDGPQYSQCQESYIDGRDRGQLRCVKEAGHDGPHADYSGKWLVEAVNVHKLRAIVIELAALDPQDEDGAFCRFCSYVCDGHAPTCIWRRAREATK